MGNKVSFNITIKMKKIRLKVNFLCASIKNAGVKGYFDPGIIKFFIFKSYTYLKGEL